MCGATLRTLSGATYRLIFQGRRNGGPGPDFRDAALEMEDGARLLGDIELHLRARDWLAHGHHTDNRYKRVMLHVALDTADAFSPLASGGAAPIVCLSFTQATPLAPPLWPCADLDTRIGPVAMRTLLLWAGSARFERRVHALADTLTSATPDASETGTATCAQTGCCGSRWPSRSATTSVVRPCAWRGCACFLAIHWTATPQSGASAGG